MVVGPTTLGAAARRSSFCRRHGALGRPDYTVEVPDKFGELSAERPSKQPAPINFIDRAIDLLALA